MGYPIQLAERLKAADPVRDPAAPPEGAWGADRLLLEIERRSGVMQTVNTKDESDQPARERRATSRLRPRPAAVVGGLAAIVAVIAATAILVNRAGDDAAAADRTPLQTVELYYERFEAGDHQGALELYAPDATYAWTDEQNDFSEGLVLSSDPYTVPHNVRSQVDWDGDEAITSADSRAGFIVNQHAAGIQMRAECTAEGETVTCAQDPISAFISDESRLMDGTVTFTVRDGLIVGDAYVIDFSDVGLERSLQGDYEMWVRENHPDQADGLFVPNTGLPGHMITSTETALTHRRLIAEWLEAIGA